MEQNYTFTSIEKVEYRCLRDVPTGMAEYEVTAVIADDGTDILSESEFYCEPKCIPWRADNLIPVPFSYRKNHDLLTMTARHIPTRITCEFTITFDKWEVIFEDNFDGTELDSTKWSHRPEMLRDRGYANYWSKKMTFLDGKGNLVSRVLASDKKDTDGRPIYYSGAIWSKDLFESDYGYYEICAKLHHNTGMWGAFWLLCGDMVSQNPPDDNSSVDGCEVDIFESLYNFGGVNHAIHWDGFKGYTKSIPNKGYATQINVYDNTYHTFALRWSPDEYIFYIDGQISLRSTAAGICTKPGFMLITSECGPWGDELTLKSGEYSDMLVDYVRVYKNSSDPK